MERGHPLLPPSARLGGVPISDPARSGIRPTYPGLETGALGQCPDTLIIFVFKMTVEQFNGFC